MKHNIYGKFLICSHRLAGYNIPWITNRIDDGQRLNYAVEGLLVWKEYEFQVSTVGKEEGLIEG